MWLSIHTDLVQDALWSKWITDWFEHIQKTCFFSLWVSLIKMNWAWSFSWVSQLWKVNHEIGQGSSVSNLTQSLFVPGASELCWPIFSFSDCLAYSSFASSLLSVSFAHLSIIVGSLGGFFPLCIQGKGLDPVSALHAHLRKEKSLAQGVKGRRMNLPGDKQTSPTAPYSSMTLSEFWEAMTHWDFSAHLCVTALFMSKVCRLHLNCIYH